MFIKAGNFELCPAKIRESSGMLIPRRVSGAEMWKLTERKTNNQDSDIQQRLCLGFCATERQRKPSNGGKEEVNTFKKIQNVDLEDCVIGSG